MKRADVEDGDLALADQLPQIIWQGDELRGACRLCKGDQEQVFWTDKPL